VKHIFLRVSLLLVALFIVMLGISGLPLLSRDSGLPVTYGSSEELVPLLSETDLFCSFLIWDAEKPDAVIVGAEREYERDTFSDGDVIYINKGKNQGLEPGQLFLILEIKQNIEGFGTLATKRGRARVTALSDERCSAVIEKSCDWSTIGNYVIPFEPTDTVMGKNLGFDVPPFEVQGEKGEVIYLQSDFNQVGSGNWALIDQGAQDGVQVGQQMIVYRIVEEGAPVQIFGNVVVVDVQNATATVKVLTCRDALRIGDAVMPHPMR